MTSDTGYVGIPPSQISPSKMPTAYLLVPPRRGLRRPPVLPAIKKVLNLQRRGPLTGRSKRDCRRNWARWLTENHLEESTGGLSSRYSGMYEWKRTYGPQSWPIWGTGTNTVIVNLEGRTIMRAAWRNNDLGYCARLWALCQEISNVSTSPRERKVRNVFISLGTLLFHSYHFFGLLYVNNFGSSDFWRVFWIIE